MIVMMGTFSLTRSLRAVLKNRLTARANEKCPSGILLKEEVPGKIGPLVPLGFYLQL